MKKIIYSFLIACVTVLPACNKQLDQQPISSATTATFYKIPSDFVQGVNAIYTDLRNYPGRILNLSEIRSDNIYGVSVTVRDWDPINNMSPGISSNAYVEEAWTTDFNGIFRANIVLDQIATNGSLINSATLASRLQAEARFLRAFYYFDLVKLYGKVPVVDHPLTAVEATTVGRSSVEDVYKFIIADLQFAITNLPPTYTGADVGRATKYAAEGILAKVYMARSGPTYGIEGPGLGLNEWSLAIPLINDIIAGPFVFNTSFSNIFAYTNTNPSVNKEAIFDVMYAGGLSGTADQYGASFPWALAPNTYFLSLGDTRSNGSLEIIPVSNDLVASYAANDVRKTFAINTTPFTNAGSTETRPFFKKYLDVTKIPTTSRFDWPVNFIALRFTDILMMKAECILHGAAGSQADVDGIVNQVRGRAGVTGTVSNVTLPQLFEERRREFADEGMRWFDLQRSGDLVTIMNAWITKEDTQKRINAVTANYVIYPVPQSQLNAVPGLYTQNRGY